jgi:hypothetical protein
VASTGWSGARDTSAIRSASLHIQISIEHSLSRVWNDNLLGIGRSWRLAICDSSEFGWLCPFPDYGGERPPFVGNFDSWKIAVVRLAISLANFAVERVTFGIDPMDAPYHPVSNLG